MAKNNDETVMWMTLKVNHYHEKGDKKPILWGYFEVPDGVVLGKYKVAVWKRDDKYNVKMTLTEPLRPQKNEAPAQEAPRPAAPPPQPTQTKPEPLEDDLPF